MQTAHDPGTPRITHVRVVPVAGRDSMLMNLSGAHAPLFTRNLLTMFSQKGVTQVGLRTAF